MFNNTVVIPRPVCPGLASLWVNVSFSFVFSTLMHGTLTAIVATMTGFFYLRTQGKNCVVHTTF